MKKINTNGIHEYIKENSTKMYKVISELENIMLNGNYYEHDEYQIPSTETIELEEYLESYIESMHICICTMMEHYELENLYKDYLTQYAEHSKTSIKYYSEVGVFDSPIWGMMCKYVKSLSFLYDVDPMSNNFEFHADLSNKVENKNIVSIGINEIVTRSNDIIKSLDSLSIENEEFSQLRKNVVEAVSSKAPETSKKNIIKDSLNKLCGFLLSNSSEIIKEEMKLKFPFVMKPLLDLIENIFN